MEQGVPPIDPLRSVLLVVDVQSEYWSKCNPVREDFPEFPRNCDTAIRICRSKGVEIIFVRADYVAEQSPWLGQFRRLNYGVNCKVEPKFVAGVNDTEWELFAVPNDGEFVVVKPSWDASDPSTGLSDYLKARSITNVLLLGLITSVCVQHSAFGLFNRGFRVLVIADACADRGRARHDAALSLYGNYMYDILTCSVLQQNIFYREGEVQSHHVENTNPCRSSSSSSSSSNSTNETHIDTTAGNPPSYNTYSSYTRMYRYNKSC